MRKNKLMISAITLAFAVVAVVSTTFAWFTMNTTNTVDNLDFSAASSSGLYMSLDGSNWKTSLSKADFDAYAAAKPSNLKGYGSPLSPVTYSTADNKTGLVDHTNELTEKGYVEFTIKFKSDVKSTVKVTTLGVSDVTKQLTLKYTKNGSGTNEFWQGKDSANATGIKFGTADDGTLDLSTSLANAVRVRLTGTGVTEQFIDPKSGEGFGGIETNLATSISHQYLSHVSPKEATEIESKFGVKNNTLSNVKTDYKALNSNEVLLTLAEGSNTYYEGSVTVTVWVDGFDQDCFDVLFGSTLVFNLEFKATEVTPVPQP